MPTYTYRNIKTGKKWEEIRKIDDRLDGVDGINIEMVLAMPRIKDPTISTKRGQDFYDKILAPKKKRHKGII